MKTNKTTRLMAGFVVACLAGCVTGGLDTARPEEVRQTYRITYDGDFDTTSVGAQLVVGQGWGKTLHLSGRSNLAHERIPMQESAFLGISYGGNERGFHPAHSFAFTDMRGTVYRNAVELVPVDFAADAPATLHRSREAHVAFTGGPARPGESVILEFEQGNDKKTRRESVRARQGETEIVVPAKWMHQFADGPARMRLVRSWTENLQEGTPAGGSINVDCRSATRTVTLAP